MKKISIILGSALLITLISSCCGNNCKKFPAGKVEDDSTEVVITDSPDSTTNIDTGIEVVTI